ncbi:MAG TPA: polysaccharide biosynthesis/export family protein [Stellaceae bacterium]|nr:polysaccharide biosynthesis/export family protein [Stellaceae bacterium]
MSPAERAAINDLAARSRVQRYSAGRFAARGAAPADAEKGGQALTAWIKLLAAAVMLAAVGACTPSAPNIASDGVVPGGVPLTDEHTLAPGDEVEIRFPYMADLNDRVVVGPDGRVSLQLVNTVALGGLTVDAATKLLNDDYAKLVKSPTITLTVRSFAPESVFVDGWVNTPGLVRSDVPLTVSRALAQAGGVKTGAKTDSILVLRRGPDGKTYYYQVGHGNYAGAGPSAQDPMLKSYDVVYVPQTTLASISDFLATYVKNIPFYFSYAIQ